MTTVLVLVVAATVEEQKGFFAQHACRPDVICIWNRSGRGLASTGNAMLVDAMEIEDIRSPPPTIFGLCHADVILRPGALDAFYDCAADGNVCGIVGRDLGGRYRWCGEHEDGKRGLALGNPGPVSTLDSCSVFFRTNLGLRFDEKTFDGFHCHVEDLCLQAQAKGIPVVVPAANASHPLVTRHTGEDRKRWEADYRKYRQRLAEKWAGVRFETT
jgi:hypothetical protein